MSHRKEKRLRRTTHSALVAAVSLDLLAIALPAAAQAQNTPAASQEADELDEIVVTGFRASLQSALANKRNAIQPIESIAPEDIGKMPDQNVAESLQRLPGVQINRAGGKGTQVLIDGLSNNLITLNGEVFLTGREFYVSGEASGGGAGGTIQYASLEGIPSEQIGGIDVIKNPTAANREGGLGGTVNLKTRSALSQTDGFNLGGNVRYGDADDTDGSATPNVTLVGGYKFGERFAFTVGASYDEEETHNKEFQDQNRNQWLITDAAQVGSYVGAPAAATLSTMPGGQLYIVPQLAYFTDQLQNIKTKGATLGLEWKWSDNITSSLNYFYVNELDESTSYSNKVFFNGQGSAPGTLHPGIDPSQPFEIDDNLVVRSATFTANGAETSTLYQNMESTSNNFQFVTRFEGDGKFSGNFGLFYAKADSNLQAAQADVEHGLYNYSSPASSGAASPSAPGCNNGGASCDTGNHGYEFAWTNGGTSGLPTVTYPDGFGFTNILFNPAYTTFKSNWAWANEGDETSKAFNGNLHFKFNDTLTLSGGLRLSDRDVDQTFGRYLIDGATAGTGGVAAGAAAGNCCIAAGQSGTFLYYQDPGYAAIPFSITGSLPVGSPGASLPSLGLVYNSFGSGPIMVKDPAVGGITHPSTYLETIWQQSGVPNATESFFVDTLSSFKVAEKTTAAYLMGDVGDAESDYHANFGVRVVKTELEVDGGSQLPVPTWYGTASWNGVNANNGTFSNSRSYTDVLPSFNFVLDVTENQKVRVGAARVVAPQNLMQLGVGNSYNFTRGADGPGGQARFQFANGSSGNPSLDPFRASQYNLSWEDYVGDNGLFSVGTFYKQVDNFVSIANIPTLVNDDFGGTVGNVSTPVNAGKGKIYGAELGAQYAWTMGFGVAANYTYSQSQSDQDTSFAQDLPIPGVSKNSANLIGYYEKAGFSARAAYSWRSKAVNSSLVGSTFSFPDQNGTQVVYGVYSAPYTQLDGQVGYDFKAGGMDLGVLFSVINLTNEKQHTYLQYENLPFTYNDTGRRLFLGVKFKL
ncbi:MAG TPA: TonB-dependent receptor [Steroidobacteraceae bacterium]|jgi:TonB-dependent receptor|nr:TonB-dependent receptor [Steroidobacteraceae bacterium]